MEHKPRHFATEVKQINKDGSVRYRLTSKKVDRAGEVMLPDGINLDNYKNNPIVLFGHGYKTNVPIGKIDPDSFKITSNYVDADVIFDEEGKDPFAEMIGDKVRNGFLNAGSIGFRPTVIGDEPVLPKQTGATIKEWELFEFSIVPVPANPDALARREFYDECKSLAPDLDDEVFADLDDEVLTDLSFYSKKLLNKHTMDEIFKNRKYGKITLVDDVKELIEKTGRVLSSKNRTLVKNVANNMRSLLEELDTLLAATEPKPADDKEMEEQDYSLIKNTLESIEIAKFVNNINDLKGLYK